MIQNQVLNKVLATGDYDIISKNGLTEEFFPVYVEEFNFVKHHYEVYGKVPDEATFFAKFTDFARVDVTEPDNYLVDSIYEEALFNKASGVLRQVSELLKVNSNDALDYIKSQLPSLSSVHITNPGTDIVSEAVRRYESYDKRLTSEKPWYITTGFEELDEELNGWTKGEELAVIFARTGQGKSWVLEKSLEHAQGLGYRVGCISPEMSAEKYGYRFDTLRAGFSNTALIRGRKVDGYSDYIQQLKQNTTPFIVATPKEFNKQVTVSKLKHFCEANKLDILGIDGITYLTDERGKKSDNKTTALTNISEDLMSLSLELQIPILVVVQSNRQGVRDKEEDGTPDLENIRDSDGIAHNATKVLSIRQTGEGLEIGVKKHRDGRTGGKFVYAWDIDTGNFSFIKSDNRHNTTESVRTTKPKQVKTGVDCF